MTNIVPVPARVQPRLRALWANYRQAERELQICIETIRDTLGLEGAWLVNVEAMTMQQEIPTSVNGKEADHGSAG